MDVRTGEIYTEEQVKALEEQLRQGNNNQVAEKLQNLVQMKKSPTEKQMNRKPPKVGRNEPCPCDSGKKFKHCCLRLS